MSEYISPYTGKRYVSPRLERKPTGEREAPWQCTCVDPWTNRRLKKYARHQEPYQCVTDEELQTFQDANPGAPPRKWLARMWMDFGR